MSTVHPRHAVTVKAVLELDEVELAALDALVGYGTDAFLKSFYTHMGRAYLEPHEKGLRSLFETIRGTVPRALSDAKTARQLLAQRHTAGEPARGPVPDPTTCRPGWWQRLWSRP